MMDMGDKFGSTRRSASACCVIFHDGRGVAVAVRSRRRGLKNSHGHGMRLDLEELRALRYELDCAIAWLEDGPGVKGRE